MEFRNSSERFFRRCLFLSDESRLKGLVGNGSTMKTRFSLIDGESSGEIEARFLFHRRECFFEGENKLCLDGLRACSSNPAVGYQVPNEIRLAELIARLTTLGWLAPRLK